MTAIVHFLSLLPQPEVQSWFDNLLGMCNKKNECFLFCFVLVSRSLRRSIEDEKCPGKPGPARPMSYAKQKEGKNVITSN